MNPIMKKGLLILFFLLGITYAGLLSFYTNPGTEISGIVCIEIRYDCHFFGGETHKYYRIERIDDDYYSNGQKIDAQSIRALEESFTDLYESTEYEFRWVVDFFPHFTVLITLENGDIVLQSDSSGHCFIPWNVEYKGKSYVQYNGKIPTALLKILIEVDKEEWVGYDKKARWGCYPAKVPDEYGMRGISPDFPKSFATIPASARKYLLWEVDVQDTIVTPTEYVNGIMYLAVKDKVMAFNVETRRKMWEITLSSFIAPPQYFDGHLYVVVEEGVIVFDAKTGKKIWNRTFEEVYTYKTSRYLSVHDGAVYIGTREPSVYKLDAESGSIIWKYTDGLRSAPRVRVSGDNLLVYSLGIRCLKRDTGENVWKLEGFLPRVVYYSDTILIESMDESPFFYALLDKRSGRILWRGTIRDIDEPDYYKGIFCFGRKEDSTLVALDVQTMEEVWEYNYNKNLNSQEAFEKGIVLLIYDEEEKYLDRIVHLGWDGSEIWEYKYEDMRTPPSRARMEIFQDTIFIVREGGFIEAFDFKNGDKLWETEVRGSEIGDVRVYEGRIYLSANDGVLYCLDIETGEIVWEFYTGGTTGVPDWRPLSISEVVDGIIFVVAEDGRLFIFSL